VTLDEGLVRVRAWMADRLEAGVAVR
jgi:hypothetical protein